MTPCALPNGIRSFTLQNGRITYEARVNRRNSKPMSRRFQTVTEATNWKAQAEALIEAGIDPHPVVGKNRRLTPPPAGFAPASPSSETASETGLTVKQAVENYLSFRHKSHNPLPSNSATDYERVASDFGDFFVSTLRNEDLANYITVLLSTPLKRISLHTSYFLFANQ